MGRELKTFILPQLVEARKRGDSDIGSVSPHSPGHALQLSTSSASSDLSSPSTPTFSTRSHSRLPSSTSTLASSPTMRESADGFGGANRPLTDVKEEPQDRDEDYEMIESDEVQDEIPPRVRTHDWSLYQSTALDFSPTCESPDDVLENDFPSNPCTKRRRAEEVPLSPMDGLTSRLGSAIPSLSRSISRKWHSRRVSPTMAMPDRFQEPSLSRANSTRAPSLNGSVVDVRDVKAAQLPTPTRSAFDESFENNSYEHLDIEKANSCEEDALDREAKPTTPLLPPIMTQIPADIREVPYQSPLQSPSVADPEASSVLNTPLPTPRIGGLPSPPLSSKPSTASFRLQRGQGPLSPSSEIPPMLITDPNDHWAAELGHANFTIHPEPYLPEEATGAACKKFVLDRGVAYDNYTKHLMRTGEHYGVTSKIYRLTEEKWAEVDAKWKTNSELLPSRVAPPIGSETLSQSHVDALPEPVPVPVLKMPALNGPKSEGKFPTTGDEGIVGPMAQDPPREQISSLPRKRKRKLGFFRWVQGVWPAGAGVLSRRSSSGA